MENIFSRGMVMWRFTQVYPRWTTIDYIVAAHSKKGNEVGQWDDVKKAALETIIKFATATPPTTLP